MDRGVRRRKAIRPRAVGDVELVIRAGQRADPDLTWVRSSVTQCAPSRPDRLSSAHNTRLIPEDVLPVLWTLRTDGLVRCINVFV